MRKKRQMQHHDTRTNRILPAGGIICAAAALAVLLTAPRPALADEGSPVNPNSFRVFTRLQMVDPLGKIFLVL